MWDVILTALTVAAASLYVVKRIFLRPRCKPVDTGCNSCGEVHCAPPDIKR
jgi:hypothetical protein